MVVCWNSSDGVGFARISRQTALQMEASELASVATFCQEVVVIIQIVVFVQDDQVTNNNPMLDYLVALRNVMISCYLYVEYFNCLLH